MPVHAPDISAHDRKANVPFCSNRTVRCQSVVSSTFPGTVDTNPLATATAATMIFPTKTAITACHTASPVDTSEAPIWKLLKAIWLIAQKLTNAHLVHVRRCGGSGRMSSLIHTFTTLLSLDGIRTNSRNDRIDISPDVLVRFNYQTRRQDER